MDATNCALGEDGCKCARILDAVGDDAVRYWECEQWGRSSLPVHARIGHGRTHWGSPSIDAAKRHIERTAKNNVEMNKRLRDIRASDPRKHLRKKGIKI